MNTKKGFTLVELLVVIAILAILATVSVVGYTSFIDRAKESNANTEAHQVETAITSGLVIPGDVVKAGNYSLTATNGKYYLSAEEADITVELPVGSSVVLENNKLYYVSKDNIKVEMLTVEAHTCADADKDHDCDVCGAVQGEHKEGATAGKCDYCGKAVTPAA